MPEILTTTGGLFRVLGLVVGEVLALVIVAVVLNAVIRLVFRRLDHVSKKDAISQRVKVVGRTLRAAIVLTAVLCSAAVVAFDAWLVWDGEDPLSYTIELVGRIPPEAWLALVFGLLKIVGVAIVARVLLRLTISGLVHLENRAAGWDRTGSNRDSLAAFFRGFTNVLTNAVWMLVAVFATWQLALPKVFYAALLRGVTIYLIVGIGLIVVRIVALVVATLDGLSRRYAENRSWSNYYTALQPLIPMLRRCLEYAIWIGTASLVLAQLRPIATLATYGPRLIKAIGIFFIARVAIEVGHLLIEKQIMSGPQVDELERRRRETILPLVKTIFRVVAYFIALVMILSALGINIVPFLAGAGILGVVIGLGAQQLINDVVNGFLVLFESIYLVGDFIDAGDARGTVEAIDFRTTRLRDPDGNLHTVRNGNLDHVKNFCKGYTFAVVEVRVGYEMSVTRVREILTECGKQLREEFGDTVTSDLEIRGIVEFEDSAMRFRTVTPVLPGKHFPVAARLRELIKIAFDEAGIRIPYPQRRIVMEKSQGE